MAGGTIQVVDAAGRAVIAGVDDQPLRVRLELDIEPDSAPDTITVDLIGPDGTKRPIEAERVDWGATRPLYQSELTTIDDQFDASFELLDPITGHVPRVESGDWVRFEYEDLSNGVQVFDSGLDARWWFTQAEIADRIGAATNRGIRLTGALRQIREMPESEERAALEQQTERRLESVQGDLALLDKARKALNNDKYWTEQQIQGAQYYLGVVDPRFTMGIHDVLEKAGEIAQGHIVSGVKDVVIGGYQMLVQSTGVAQARTVLTGENELGQAVTWDGRVTAFLDLVADGFLQGASLKFELDHLAAPARIRPNVPDPRPRYDGPSPEKLAPERSIVDPTSMGMTPEAVRAAFRASRMHDKYTLVRPTNVDSPTHLQAGALPKPEPLKSKTVGEIDTLIGVAPETRGTVGFFKPTTDFFESTLKANGVADAEISKQVDLLKSGARIEPPAGYAGADVWNAAVKRYHQRNDEFHGPTGKATRKLVANGEIVIRDGVIYNAETGQVYAGDHDLFDFIDAAGLPVDPSTYTAMVSYLENSAFRAQHGAHKWWDPQRSDFPAGADGLAKFETNRGIYEKIIESHKGGEILIVFPPVGPPIALFSGTAPGHYLGHMPGTMAPAAPGSSLMLPTEVRFLGTAGTTRRSLTSDPSIQEWLESESAFNDSLRTYEEELNSTDPDAFDAMAAASAARAAQLDAELSTDDDYDVEEFDTETAPDGDTESEPGTADSDAFDAMAAASAARAAQLDAELSTDDDYDVEEFDTETAPTTEPARSKTPYLVGGGILGGLILIVLILALSGGNGSNEAIDEPTTQAATQPPTEDAAATDGDQNPQSEPADEPTDAAAVDAAAEPAQAEQTPPLDPCEASAFGCTDFGADVATDAAVGWSEISSCEDTSSETAGARIYPASLGLHAYIPGFGSCEVGNGTVTCPGSNQRGQSEDSSGNVTLLGYDIESTQVTETGFTGTAQEWAAPAASDGTPDMTNSTCRQGGEFAFAVDPAEWAAALNSPTYEEPPIRVGEFACIATWEGDSVVLTWSTLAELSVPEPESPFAVDLAVRFNGWVQAPGGVLAVVGPDDVPTVNYVDDEGNVQSVPGPIYGAMLRSELAERIRTELGEDEDAFELIDELGLDVWDPNGAMEVLSGTGRVMLIGRHEFNPADGPETAEALQGFEPGDLIDAQPRIRNGAFGSFAPSTVCAER